VRRQKVRCAHRAHHIVFCFPLAQARSDCCVLAVQKTFFLLEDRRSSLSSRFTQ
jgi:hypothetical protein